ncbi:DUF6624 domain-containing protein [Fulvivirga lutimaris]|uniref:DUF6624 domain-containing protein n=1 Tax=Fulvivirga lutimaris TaxID=1819566 RepID=UPI0012BBE6CD|nr:DUF6624 domain-containing protein [Fulvivirga lutimaris]MTI39320.1 hypothetical protein [Fulvivirga lutimaris]
MRSIIIFSLCCCISNVSTAQDFIKEADSLKKQGLLMPALEKYGTAFMQNYSASTSYQIASTCALLWTREMRDTSFYFLNYALEKDSSLSVLYDPQFLSLIGDERWENIEKIQVTKYENIYGPIKNEPFARALFRMIIKDQGFMYAGNLERKKYLANGGYFSSPAVFPMLAMEEKNLKENEKELIVLLEKYGWPTASSVTEYAAAGAALIINHTTYELRSKYFPLLEEAFNKGEAQPLRYAKMRDRLLVEEGREQLYGTQWKYEGETRFPHKIKDPQYVDKRRAAIGLEPLSIYLKERFDIEWNIDQK